MDDQVTPPSFSSSAPPPPPLTPPPFLAAPAPAAPAPQQKKKRGWMVFALVLLVLLGISFLYNVAHALGGGLAHGKNLHSRSVGPKLDEVVTEDNDADNKIAVIEIAGIITSRSMDQGGYNLVELVK